MYYEINVSLDGTHFFAIAERSIQNDEKLNQVVNVMLVKFPVSEGYKITVTRWDKVGTEVKI